MNKKLVSSLMFMVLLTGCATGGPNQMGGTLLGGAAGGLLGSQIGGGHGRLVAVGLGTLAGALAGGAVGKHMDNSNNH